VSSKALRAWPAWTTTKLLYTQTDGPSEQPEPRPQAFRIYDAASVTSQTLTVENASITDVTHVLIAPGEVAFVTSMRDGARVPCVALANQKSGVYRRECRAGPGAITKDMIVMMYFGADNLVRLNGALSRITRVRAGMIRLLPGDPSPVGTWMAVVPPVRGAKIILTVRPSGQGE